MHHRNDEMEYRVRRTGMYELLTSAGKGEDRVAVRVENKVNGKKMEQHVLGTLPWLCKLC